MEENRVIHPSADVLQAFVLGLLNDATASAVMSHLDNCPDCCKQAAAVPGDDFLQRLHQACGRGFTPAPATSLDDVSRAAKPPARPAPIRDLPLELANNPQYEILRELGRGGMGVVYLARNKLVDRLEVLKVVNKTLLDRPAALERFLREIRSTARLSHPNVVTAYSAVQQGELLALAMEYVHGQDLASLVETQGPLPIPHACFYVQQAAWGLQHAFEKGMIHRDIKPQNLILAREGRKHIVKVLDFGLAKILSEKTEDAGLTSEGKMLGTPAYIAPEQSLDAAKADIRADIYSLGCTLFFLLSGRPPFSCDNLSAVLMAHRVQEAEPLNLMRPQVPEELAAVVLKMMAKEPADRYQTPLAAAQALAPFVKQRATPKPEPEPEHPASWQMRTAESSPSAQSERCGTDCNRLPASGKTATRKSGPIGGSIGVGVLLLALLGMWASGAFEVKTPNGAAIIALEVDRPGAEMAASETIEVRLEQVKPVANQEDNPPAAAAIPAAGADDFVQLFNGKDKTGWRTNSIGENAWRVENGVLIWDRSDRSFLWTESNDYRDFHLRVETRISDGGYAQLIVRDRFGQSDAIHAGIVIVLNSTNRNSRKTGSLGLTGGGTVVSVPKSPVRPDQWCILEVIAEGNRIIVKVNGRKTADYFDPGRRFVRGHVTLMPVNQLNGGQRHLEFRAIEIKKLRPR